MGKIDMTGWIMKEHGVPESKLTVLYETGERKNKQIVWHCKCECGNECDVIAPDIRSGHTKSCGCGKKKIIDMTGWIMKEHGVPDSRWTVLYEIPERKDGRVYWHCKCECGTERDITGDNLRLGESKSCGCLQREKASEKFIKILPKGAEFGKLSVLNMLDEKADNGKILYLCQCECGNIVKVLRDSLVSGNTKSCGCLKSRGEDKISQIFRDNNILFEKEKTFDNCRFEDTNYPAKFDFYVNNQYLIEYDGSQHFKSEDRGGWNTKENLIKTQEHDKFKNQYCFEYNIPLIRIPYTRLDDLCLEDLIPETSQFLLK